MQVSSEDRPEQDPPPLRNTQSWFILAIAVLILLVGGYFLFFYEAEEEPVIEPLSIEAPPIQPEPDLTPTPEIPPQQPQAQKEPLVLPPLAESDVLVRDRVREKVGELGKAPELDLWLQAENLLQRSATLVDGMSRGVLLKKVLPVAPPSKPFTATQANNSLWMDMSGYRRYDRYVQLFIQMDPQAAAGLFHTFRPLLEEAYSQLGRKGENLDKAVIKSIDLMLAAPEIDGAIELERESVQYKYADPKLEALPPLQKQLLRMGPENTRKLKAHLRKIREALLAPDV